MLANPCTHTQLPGRIEFGGEVLLLSLPAPAGLVGGQAGAAYLDGLCCCTLQRD
jgi:hypothetical protein